MASSSALSASPSSLHRNENDGVDNAPPLQDLESNDIFTSPGGLTTSPKSIFNGTNYTSLSPRSTDRAAPEFGEISGEQMYDDIDVETHDSSAYWMTPSLEELRSMPPKKLQSVKEFTVGLYGVGQVRFLQRVDLSRVGSLSTLAGGVILFSDRVCTVYPDENLKPPQARALTFQLVYLSRKLLAHRQGDTKVHSKDG